MSSAQWRDRIVSLERIAASQLQSHAGNWRMHPAHQEQALAGILQEVGQAAALLVYHSDRQGGLCIIDGHLRASMGQAATWPCLVLDVTDQEADLLLATLDPLAAMAQQDDERLAALLGGLQPEHEAVAALLERLANGPGGPPMVDGGVHTRGRAQAGEGDEHVKVAHIAALSQHYGTALGQLWRCGRHLVLCGSACLPESYVKILAGGVEIAAVVTDPPYGVGVPYAAFNDTLANVQGLVAEFMPRVAEYPVVALTPGIPAMWSYPEPTWVLAWVHPASSSSGPWGFNGLNPILVYGKDPYLQEGLGRRHDTLVLVDDRQGEDVHPTTKPLKMWSWLIERVTTSPGQSILDPFLGSGTSLIAAEHLERTCYGIELDPGYVALTLDRYERSTGETPKRV